MPLTLTETLSLNLISSAMFISEARVLLVLLHIFSYLLYIQLNTLKVPKEHVDSFFYSMYDSVGLYYKL